MHKMCYFVCQWSYQALICFGLVKSANYHMKPTNEIIMQLSQAWFQKGNSASHIPYKIEDRIYKDF